jgi:hypothetical protein
MRRPLPTIVTLLVLAGTTTACGADREEREEREERAITLDTTDGPSADSTATDQPVALESGAGAKLTHDQATAALLTVEELPSGYSLDTSKDEDDSDDKIAPARCQELFDRLEDAHKQDPVAKAQAKFTTGSVFGTVLDQSIGSYDDEISEDFLVTLAQTLSHCPDVTSTDKDGVETTFTMAPMSMANLGDQTLALRMTAEREGFTFHLSVAMVVIGHNLVTLGGGGLTGMDGAQLEQIGKKAINKLESVTR